MAGNTANARQWSGANVYVGDTDAVDPASISVEFGATWDLVGLLDGSDGFTETRSVDLNDLFAWGGVIVRSSRTNFKFTRSFTALEDHETTFELVYPGSTYGDNIVVPQTVPRKLAFELIDSVAGVTKRLITANYAEIDLNGDLTENDTDLQKFPLIATIIPDAESDPAVLFNTQYTSIAS